MRLYHGTNIQFETIDLSKCLPYKDFGRGFYLTDLRDQAERMAERKSTRFGKPIVLEYEIDKVVLDGLGDCIVKTFDAPDEEWAEFILANRERRIPCYEHGYDIVIGPVADDGVAYILNRYLEGLITLQRAVEELRFSRPNRQYCFCSARALKHLEYIRL